MRFRSVLLLVAIVLQSAPALAAYEFYVTVEGTKQGRFKGESPREQFKEKIPGVRYSYEVRSPRDAGSGMPSGKRQHSPVYVTKNWGAASPQFFQALVTNEVLKTVTIEFLRTQADGTEAVNYVVRLYNATVMSVKPFVDQSGVQLEDVGFTFQRIELESKDGKTGAVDDWFPKGN